MPNRRHAPQDLVSYVEYIEDTTGDNASTTQRKAHVGYIKDTRFRTVDKCRTWAIPSCSRARFTVPWLGVLLRNVDGSKCMGSGCPRTGEGVTHNAESIPWACLPVGLSTNRYYATTYNFRPLRRDLLRMKVR